MALKFVLFLSVLLPLAASAATTVTRYVNTASTAGGDGTTNNTAGATRAYATLQGAITAEVSARANLVTRDELLDIICEGSTTDTSVVLDGFTTDATRLIRIRTTQANRHDGKWNTNKYRLEANTSGEIIRIKDAYIELDGLQIGNTYTGSGNVMGVYAYNGEGSLSLKITNSVIRYTGTHTGGGETCGVNNGIFFRPDVANARFTGINNVIYGFAGGGICDNGSGYNAGEINIIYNNTVNAPINAISLHGSGSSDALYAKNNIMQGCSGSCAVNWGLFTTTVTADNITSDTTSPNTSGCSSGGTCRSKTVTFAGAGDYHLNASDTEAKDLGTDLSADAQYAFSTDIDGQTRSGTWDIGADEYQSGSVYSFPNKLNAGLNLNLNGGLN